MLTVKVDDGMAFDTAVVNITLLDINDNGPIFSRDFYTFPAINETAHVGSYVGEVQATDADAGDNSIIRFRILEGTGNFNSASLVSLQLLICVYASAEKVPSFS